MKQRVIELIGGPLAGIAHELSGVRMPSKVGLPNPNDEKAELHWYMVKDGKGYFQRTEQLDEEDYRE